MRIIPVIDLLGGVVVRGIGGRRNEYRPIISKIAADPSPGAVAAAFCQLGYDTVYVADLDAIAGKPRDWQSYQQIAAAGLALWIDAGIRGPADADEMVNFDSTGKILTGIVVGSETVGSENVYGGIADRLQERLIFSLDMKGGVLLKNKWQSASVLALAAHVITHGTKRLIVLDLARVGESRGVGTEELCRQVRALDAKIELIAGGGVRDRRDLDSLAEAGCDAALVASALHDGRLP